MEQRLGRGLDSLITRTVEAKPAERGDEIPLDSIRVNPNQPRRHWNEDSLSELAESIKRHGVIQPIVVHRVGASFELIAGERRFRASRIAGKTTVPAVIMGSEGLRSLELALIENIQREDLNAVDESLAYQQLVNQNGWTHADLAGHVGKSRAAVTNALRLLELPEEVLSWLSDGHLSAGQARAVLAVSGDSARLELARQAMEQGLSVREVERRARQGRPARKKAGSTATVPKQEHYETELRRVFGTKAAIRGTAKKGEIRLAYYSVEDRNRLLHQLLTGEAESWEEA